MGTADTAKVIFRIPMDVREWLKATAKAEHRTATAQLVRILEAAREATDLNGGRT